MIFRNIALLKKALYVSVVIFAVFLSNNCAGQRIYLNKIAAPPQTNKLRVALIAISEPFFTSVYGTKVPYPVSYEDFKKNQYNTYRGTKRGVI